MKILFEDNHLIAVEKLHGQLTQSDETGDASLFDDVKALIKIRDQKPGNVFLGLLHRLDRPVGGIVLFAKTSKAASRLSEQFRTHKIQKTYLTVVEGSLPSSTGIVDHVLLKDEEKNIVRIVGSDTPGAQRAETRYLILAQKEGRTLVELHPKTGRSHQLRVAMSSLGCPIVGDLKYGSKTPLGHALALFAKSLVFAHPISKESITVMAEPTLPEFTRFG